MKSKVSILLFGCLIGAGLAQLYHTVQSRRANALFERRLRCKGLAEQYEKDKSNEFSDVVVLRVDFSPVHNSCIASTEEINTAISRQNRIYTFMVVDLLSGEFLFRQMCRSGRDAEGQSDYCGDSREASMAKARDHYFEHELKR